MTGMLYVPLRDDFCIAMRDKLMIACCLAGDAGKTKSSLLFLHQEIPLFQLLFLSVNHLHFNKSNYGNNRFAPLSLSLLSLSLSLSLFLSLFRFSSFLVSGIASAWVTSVPIPSPISFCRSVYHIHCNKNGSFIFCP